MISFYPNFKLPSFATEDAIDGLSLQQREELLWNFASRDSSSGPFFLHSNFHSSTHIIDRNPPIYPPHLINFLKILDEVFPVKDSSYFPLYPFRISKPFQITDADLSDSIVDLSLYFALQVSPPRLVFFLGRDVAEAAFGSSAPQFGEVISQGDLTYCVLPHPSHIFADDVEEQSVKVVLQSIRDEVLIVHE